MSVTRVLCVLAVLACLSTSCASPRSSPPPAAPSPRVRDSASERAASLRAATQGQEAEDQRWGIEAAKARKTQEEERKAASQKPAPGNGAVNVNPPLPPLQKP